MCRRIGNASSTPAKSGSSSSHDAAEIDEHLPVGVDDARDLRLEGNAAQVLEPRHARALEAPSRAARGSSRRRRRGTSGSGAYGPAIALSKSATSATVRAIGPPVESGDHEPSSSGTRPGDGRKPTTFVNAAGLRSEPPVSLPPAIGTMPQRSAAAAPPLLPPTVFARSYGFTRRAEHRVEGVRARAPLRRVRLAQRDRAGVRARASRSARRSSARCRATAASRTSCGCRRCSTRSLCATGSPWSGPSAPPRA